MSHKPSRLSAFVLAAGVATAGLSPQFAEAHGYNHGGAPRLNMGIHPQTLMYGGGYRGPVYVAPRRDINPWPWVAGAIVLGATVPRPYYVEPAPVYVAPRPAPLYYPPRPAATPSVCYDNFCSAQTGVANINGELCPETIRGSQQFAICRNQGPFVRNLY